VHPGGDGVGVGFVGPGSLAVKGLFAGIVLGLAAVATSERWLVGAFAGVLAGAIIASLVAEAFPRREVEDDLDD